MTPEEACTLNDCVTAIAVVKTKLESLEEHLDRQDADISHLKERSWMSEGTRELVNKLWPIITLALGSIIATVILKFVL